MRRFFYNSQNSMPLASYQLLDSIILDDDIHHHWCRVLRAKVLDQGVLFDGFGGEYLVELLEIHKKSSLVKLLSYNNVDRTSPFECEIALVMSRGDRMDYAIQKATEMGVTSIQLLTSHHGEVTLKPNQVAKKLNHWQQIAISACEQCGLNRVPLIFTPIPMNDWLTSSLLEKRHMHPADWLTSSVQSLVEDEHYQQIFSVADASIVLAVPDEQETRYPEILTNVLKKQSNSLIRLLIGSEGGLSPEELINAKKRGYQAWKIGDRVLRTETAPVVALASMLTFHSVLNKNKLLFS